MEKCKRTTEHIGDPVVPLERNMCGHPFGKDFLGKFWWNVDGRKYQIENVCSVIGNGLFLSVYVDDIKMTGKQNMDRMWKKLMTNVVLYLSRS